jgi:peptidyl-prolyl cis-trans isomerase D
MLQFFHKLSTSIAARLLFGILLIAFVIFGIGDVLRQHGRDNDVAEVGDQTISSDQLDNAFQQTIKGKIDPATAKKMGILDNVLNSMIDDALARMAARDAGLVVGQAQVADIIQKSPAFKDEKTGTVDRQKFAAFLQMYHLSEPEFVEYLQHQTVLKLIGDTDLGALPAPPSLVDALYAFQNEQRTGQIVRLSNAAMQVPAPTPDQLTAYYHAHESDYTAPEYRGFSVILLSLPDYAKTMTVTPDEVAQSYEARKAEFVVPERRELVQVTTPDQAQAEKVATLARGGKSLAEAAKIAGVADGALNLGLMSKSDLPQPMQDPVFSAQPHTVVQPIKTGFGWGVVTVERIEPSHQIPLDQAKSAVEADLKSEKARTSLADVAKKIDDQLAGGATLAEAGKPFGLTPIVVPPVDAKGAAQQGAGLPSALKDRTDILQAVFNTAKDTAAQIQDGADGSVFAVQVTDIIPPALRPFDSVKADVVKAATTEAQAKAATARAAELLKSAQGGTPLAAIARQANAIVMPIGPLKRDSKDKALGRDVVAALFTDAKPGDVAVASTDAGPVLVQLSEINTVSDFGPAATGAMAHTLEQRSQEDIAAEYELALRKRYSVKLNEATLKTMRATE